MDLEQIMRMATQARERVESARSEAEKARVVGESGGGLVRVVMNGKHEVLELHIDPKTMVPSEVALVEDLIRAAFNQACANANEQARQKLGNMAQALGLDPSLLSGLGL
jgi:nucleoid-associated protein EbfC